MEILLIITSLSTILLGSASVILFVTQKKARSKIAQQEALEKQKIYELSILKQVQDKIGYSLDVEYIIEVIIAGLEHLIVYSTASSMVIKNNKVIFKTHAEKSVGKNFIAQVKKSMLSSLSTLFVNIPVNIEDQVVGSYIDENNPASVVSFFNIPLVVANQVVGIINISSTTDSLRNENDATVLYQIINQASSALTKLQNVLVTEKSRLTSTIGSLADGVFMADVSGNLIIINDSAKSFLKITSENPVFTEVISSFGTQYNIVEKINQAAAANQQLIDNDVTINDKSFKMFVTPVMDLTGINNHKPIGASVLMHDITIEKNINKIKEDFTHMMVHELRAPLTAVKDSSELMLDVFRGEGKMDKEQQEKLLMIIDKQSKNLLEQINQILDAAKIEAGKFTINKAPSDIGQVVHDTIEAFIPQAQKKQILLTSDVPDALPQIEIDPGRIGQVITNLISNSLKFTPPSGKITAFVKVDGDYMVVGVKDTGMGIPLNEQKELFSKYYQVKTAAHQTVKKGTGLGLFITKGIVEAHGGTVGIISDGTNGSTIYFKLPLVATAPQVVTEHFPKPGANPVSNMVN